MIKYLGRKQSSKNADWLYAMENIERLISREEVNDFAEKAVADVQRESAGIKAAYAWSGGKDSIVLGDICEKAGIETGYFAYSELDYPEFVRWCMEHKPDGVIPINTGYDLEWLSRHQNLIFAEGQLGQRWHIINQRGPFTDMFFDNGLDVLVVGHEKRVVKCGMLHWQIGRMKPFSAISITIIFQCRRFMAGRMALSSVHMRGRRESSARV